MNKICLNQINYFSRCESFASEETAIQGKEQTSTNHCYNYIDTVLEEKYNFKFAISLINFRALHLINPGEKQNHLFVSMVKVFFSFLMNQLSSSHDVFYLSL